MVGARRVSRPASPDRARVRGRRGFPGNRRPRREDRPMGSATQGVAFRVLGPLEVVVDGRTVALGSPKVRLLLAALLVDANSVVSTDRLVEALWGERPPASALSALQKLVHRLRSLVRSTQSSGCGRARDTRAGLCPEGRTGVLRRSAVRGARRGGAAPRTARRPGRGARDARRGVGAVARSSARGVRVRRVSRAPRQRGSRSSASWQSRSGWRQSSGWVATTR